MDGVGLGRKVRGEIERVENAPEKGKAFRESSETGELRGTRMNGSPQFQLRLRTNREAGDQGQA